MTNEMKLLKSAMEGNTAAFEQIVKKYQSLVCAITFSGTGRVDISEELAQETFLSAWKNLRQLTDPRGFRPWLCTIARNMLNRYYHKKKPVPLDPVHLADLSDQTQNPSENLITQEEHVMLEQALMQIPAEYREPLVLYYRQEKSTREVAAGLGLNESTVRTRLHRARQILRDEIAARLERTLERTAPGKSFTKAVMVAVGGAALGMSASASAATATASASGTGASTGITAVMSTVTAKVVTAAAVVAVTAVAVFVYQQMTESDHTPEKTNVRDAAVEEQTALEKPEIGENEAPEIQGVAVKPIDIPKIQPAASQTEIADSPEAIAPKPIECVHAYFKEGKEEVEIWAKGNKKWRYKFGDIEKICDGKRVLVLDNRNKEASFSRQGLKQPEEISEPLMIAKMIPKDFDPTKEEIKANIMGQSCLGRQNPNIESEPGEVVFEVFESDSNELFATAWIDKKTVKLNCLEAAESQGGLIGKWQYEPIDESIFSTKVPKGYELELGRYISGIVTDANLNPVTDANIYVTGLFEGPEQEIITQTNKEGIFEYELEFEREHWGIEFPVVIRAVSPSYPDRVAWTCILDPDVEVEKWPDWMPPIDPEVVVTKLEPRSKKVICKSIQALWLQLEPAGSISGIVTNKRGEPIHNATVNATLHLHFQVNKTRAGRVFTNRFSMSDKTDENGYYRIIGIPSLQGQASLNRNSMKSCSVYASANGYFQKSHYIQNAKNMGNTDVTFTEGKYCDFVLSKNDLTIRGRVIDNYGNPLAHYKGVYYMEKGSISMYPSGRLDSEGRFVIHNAPRADVIVLKKETIDDSYDWLHDKETRNSEFLPYPERRFEFNVPADVNVLDVGDLVMDYPDITAEIYVVDFEGKPVGFVECAFEQMGNKELLKDRYHKVTDEKAGKCIIENLPRSESGKGRGFRPISLRPYEKAPRKYRKMLERFPKLTYYHLKYPGDYKYYIFKLVLPRNDHRQDYRMLVYSPEGELLLEED